MIVALYSEKLPLLNMKNTTPQATLYLRKIVFKIPTLSLDEVRMNPDLFAHCSNVIIHLRKQNAE